MKTRRTIFPVTVALVAILVAGSALAQGPGHRRGQGRGDGDGFPRLERLAERLDLSEDQVQAMKKLREEGRADGVERRKEIMRLKHDLKGEMLKDEPATSKVKDLTRQIGELRTEAQVERAENRLAFRNLLTPEQRDKMLMTGQRDGKGRKGGKGNAAGRRGGQGGRGGCGGDCGGCDEKGGPGRGRR